MNPPTTRPQCGTYAGYQRHRRAHETPCTPCRIASRQYYIANNTGRRIADKPNPPERYRNGWLSLMEAIADRNTLLIGDTLAGQLCNRDNAAIFDAPEVGSGHVAAKHTAAKRAAAERICSQCPARAACADWAAGEKDTTGAYLPTPTPRRATA